jgi:glycosyltransferase involved in cell wall biosynthesis
VKVALSYKNFAANRNISHIGLGVAAMNTAKVLRNNGIEAEVHPVINAVDLQSRITDHTHIVVSAPWIPTAEWQKLVTAQPNVHFAVNCHSNVGFLQADTNGVKLMREAMEIERGTWNFHVAGNSRKFCRWVQDAYSVPCTYLPNIYHLDGPPRQRPLFAGGTLRVGAFGATRPLKNFMSAAAAALEIANRLNVPVEIHLSSGRAEGGQGILDAVRAMVSNLPTVKLVEGGWQTWPAFRRVVASMHLLIQPSYTESFNMVTADGIAEGVPSVVSDAITWAPDHWKAAADDIFDIARVGRLLLGDQHTAEDGYRALVAHNADALAAWKEFLKV